MKELSKNFEKVEKLLFNLLIGAFVVNIITLVLIYFSDGIVPIWLMFIVIPIGIYHLVAFFIHLLHLIAYYRNEQDPKIQIWRSIVGVLLSPLGLMFTFFNYMVIVLTNVW